MSPSQRIKIPACADSIAHLSFLQILMIPFACVLWHCCWSVSITFRKLVNYWFKLHCMNNFVEIFCEVFICRIRHILKAKWRLERLNCSFYSVMTCSMYLSETSFPRTFAKFKMPFSLRLFVLEILDEFSSWILGKFVSEIDKSNLFR